MGRLVIMLKIISNRYKACACRPWQRAEWCNRGMGPHHLGM